MIIKTDITDWDNDFIDKGPNVMTDEGIIKCRLDGMHSAEVGRHALVARERQLSDKNILSSNKTLLQLALVMEINRKTAKKKRVELANGRNIDIREFVSPIHDEDESEDSQKDVAIVSSSSTKGTKEAAAYLFQVVPGHIYGRLAIIAKYDNEGTAQKCADELKSKIDEIMDKLG